jgi:hypothetical protein
MGLGDFGWWKLDNETANFVEEISGMPIWRIPSYQVLLDVQDRHSIRRLSIMLKLEVCQF